MLRARVIPCLLLRDNGLVKTIRFNEPTYIGDPINAVKIFNEKEVDELIILDIDASKKNGEPNYDLLKDIASECFMPVCYGGGIRTVEQASRVVQLGIEKIAVNSAALSSSELITSLAKVLGSQSVVAGIDAKKDWLGRPRVYNAANGEIIQVPPEAQAATFASAGAGEILLNNVDRDGTLKGYDLTLVKRVSDAVSVPVIACGGAAVLEDFAAAANAGASAMAAGSQFVFQGRHRAVLISYPPYSDLEKLLGTE